MKIRRGLSLVEVVSALALLTIVVSAASSILFATMRTERISASEFNLQNSSRMLLDDVTHRIRNASAVFILPETSFNEVNIVITPNTTYIDYGDSLLLSRDWNYYGIVGNEIVHLRWNDYYERHDVQRVFHNPDDVIDFELNFSQIDPLNIDDNLINFQLTATQQGSAIPDVDILTSAEARTAMQVVDWSGAVSGAAIAYRLDEVPRTNPIARVTLILDLSGSMTSNVRYNPGFDIPCSERGVIRRITALQESTVRLINILYEVEDVEITIVLYSTSANFPFPGGNAAFQGAQTRIFGHSTHNFVSVAEHRDDLVIMANNLPANGQTNKADAFRRSYVAIYDARQTPTGGREVRDFIVFMTDGDANATVPASGGVPIIRNTGMGPAPQLNISHVAANVSNTAPGNISWGIAHPFFGSRLQSMSSDIFFVVLSGAPNTTRINQLHADLGSFPPIWAHNRHQLDEAFEGIARYVASEMWHARGPRMTPPGPPVGGP